MTDIAALTTRAHDTGFEQGSIAAADGIFGFLRRSGHWAAADTAFAAWEAGTILDVSEPSKPLEPPHAIETLLVASPRMGATQARGMGYTGDACTACQSIRVKRNGSCLVCEECGQTTGCS